MQAPNPIGVGQTLLVYMWLDFCLRRRWSFNRRGRDKRLHSERRITVKQLQIPQFSAHNNIPKRNGLPQ